MGNCQDQFHNIPDQLESESQVNEYLSNTIKPTHKAVRPNSQEVVIGVLSKQIQNQQLDRQQLHQTIRPFKEQELLQLTMIETNVIEKDESQRYQLDFDFYHSLALPQYSYLPIPELYENQFRDVQVYEQQDKNGVKYIGQWKNNQVHGNGIMKSNTVKYIGQFMNGLKHFHGRQIEKYQVYQGQFAHGRRKGVGQRYTPQQEEQGNFDDHLVKGMIKYKNGDTYEGQLHNKKYHGEGKLVTNKGAITYEGTFTQGKMCGNAIIHYSDGKFYKGELYNGLKHGKGYFLWNDINFYEGQYLRGKKHGKGILMRDGTLYEGTFKNGLMDGKMFVCEARGNEKINPRVEEYSGGTRINEYEESISEDLPEHWKAVIHQ